MRQIKNGIRDVKQKRFQREKCEEILTALGPERGLLIGRVKSIRVEVKREEETNLTFSRVPNLINLDDVTLNFVDCFTFSSSPRCRKATETTFEQSF